MWDGSWEKGGWNENRGRMEEVEMKMRRVGGMEGGEGMDGGCLYGERRDYSHRKMEEEMEGMKGT
jgi:hypothetical protein